MYNKKITLNKIGKAIKYANYQAMKHPGLEYSVYIDLNNNDINIQEDSKNTRYICEHYLYVFHAYRDVKVDKINESQHYFLEYSLDDLTKEALIYYENRIKIRW